jgi:anaerobic magnesium-protoporphyrin IX monomethyl ester cyclase
MSTYTPMSENVNSAHVVLYYPRFYLSGFEHDWIGFPNSVLFLAASLRDSGYKCTIVDERTCNDPLSRVSDEITNGAKYLGVSTITGGQLRGAIMVSKHVREHFPEVKIIWGGWHPSLLPEQSLREDYIDFIIRGQGQITLDRLLYCLECGLIPHGIKGVSYKYNGTIVHNENTKVTDLNSLPRLPYELVEVDRYIYQENDMGAKHCISYASSQGCSHNCSFCSVYSVYQKRWTGITCERILDDIRGFIREWDIDGVLFSDDNFMQNPSRVHNFCEGIKDGDLKITWGADGRADQLLRFTKNDWRLMYDSGFRKVFIGIETGNRDVMKLLSKNLTIEDQLKAVALCHEYGVIPVCSFMIGFPLNPRQEIRDTVKLLEAVVTVAPEAETILYAFLPYPGTPLYNVSKIYGMDEPKTFEEWAEYSSDNVMTPWIDAKTKSIIERLQMIYSYRNTGAQLQQLINKLSV